MVRRELNLKELTIIFGASNYGKKLFKHINESHEVLAFCDNDPQKWGKHLYGKPIISVEDLITKIKEKKIKIIIASSYYIEILNQLSSIGITFVYITRIQIIQDYFCGKTHEELTIIGYDISDFSKLKIIENRIGLIIRNNSGSNTFALSKEIPNRIKEKFEVIVIHENEDIIENYKKLYSCKVIVTTHSNNLDFLNSDERIFIQLWHGIPMKGVGKLDKSIPVERKRAPKTWEIYSKIASYSDFFSTVINGCFGKDINNYEITGAPRNDFLFNSNGKENLSKIINVDLSGKKVVYYTPTFRLNKYHEFVSGNKNWSNFWGFEEFNFEQFSQFLEENDIFLILKMHPYEEKFVKDMIQKYKIKNTVLLLDESLGELDFYETLNACDLLITDYSSIFYDYLLLDRPIIFTPVDLMEYVKNTGMLYGPYNFWTPGDKAFSQQELQELILINLLNANKYRNERKIIRDITHFFKDNKSCSRVWDLIERCYEEKVNKKLI